MNITLIGIFLEGLLSFLSPCVLPLLPLYMSYLAGNNSEVDEQGNVKYKTIKVFITTLFFVLGILLTFVILALSIQAIKQFLENYKIIISIIGGTLLIIFGLHEIGLIHIDVLDKELKIKLSTPLKQMNYFKAFLLGFVFSLGWSPCIGPMLASALALAATSSEGYLYLLLYGLGLVIPFIITGLMTSSVLNFFNNKKNIMKWVLKVSGIIIICFGVYMIYGASQDIKALNVTTSTEDKLDIFTYEFKDQNGKSVTLADYKGKYVMLNFTTSWCTYCKQEIPEYLEFSNNHKDDVVCLYVMTPLQEASPNDIDKHLKDNDIKLNTLIDEEGILFYLCNISSFPTIYVISPDSKFITYYSGALDANGFESLLQYSINIKN